MTPKHIARSLLVFWLLLTQPVYALPVTVIDPTKRSFSYDPNGNLTEEKKVATDESTRYAYDPLNRLTGVSSLRGGVAPEAISLATYTYDGEGKRISATEGGVTTTYAYDGLLPVLERQGSSTTINVWGLSLGGGIGGLLARVTPSGTVYPLYDGSGNILAWTDSTGAIVSTTSYTAFGEVVARSGSDPAGSDPFGFSTKAFSSTTGLAYFGARYYSPALARWLTPDPLGMVDGPNLYAYVGNNPMGFIDPFGLSKAMPWWQFLRGGYWAGTGFGEYAAEWYAQRYVETGAWWYYVGGAVSSAWTPETWIATTTTLAGGWSIAGWASRTGPIVGYQGGEITLTTQSGDKFFRLAPFGNPGASNPAARRPHYHRRPGIGRHRPWQGGF